MCSFASKHAHTHTHTHTYTQSHIDARLTFGCHTHTQIGPKPQGLRLSHEAMMTQADLRENKKKNMRKASQRQCFCVSSPIKLTSENWHATWHAVSVPETALLFRFLHNHHKPRFLWLTLTRGREQPLNISRFSASVSFCEKSYGIGMCRVNRLFQWNRGAIIKFVQSNEKVVSI